MKVYDIGNYNYIAVWYIQLNFYCITFNSYKIIKLKKMFFITPKIFNIRDLENESMRNWGSQEVTLYPWYLQNQDGIVATNMMSTIRGGDRRSTCIPHLPPPFLEFGKIIYLWKKAQKKINMQFFSLSSPHLDEEIIIIMQFLPPLSFPGLFCPGTIDN